MKTEQTLPPMFLLAPGLREKLKNTGIGHEALAGALRVDPNHFENVWAGLEAPSLAFMAGAIKAKLADHPGQVAYLNPALGHK